MNPLLTKYEVSVFKGKWLTLGYYLAKSKDDVMVILKKEFGSQVEGWKVRVEESK